jgi:aspartate/methionine/tyrosine aminotransferase
MRFSERANVDHGPNRLEAALRAALSDADVMTYRPRPLGDDAARAAVAADLSAHGVPVEPWQVMLTASTSEAYGFLFKLLCDPGDAVLAPTPGYPLFDHLARFCGVRLDRYRTAYDGAWHVDAASLAAGVHAGTRAVLTVHPANPTGAYTSAEDFSRLAATGRPIISDEVFSRYPLRDDVVGASAPRSALEVVDGVPVFALGGLSKLAGLPQLKCGWIVVGGPEDAARDALGRLELIGDTWLSVGTPVQAALPRILALRGETEAAILDRARTHHARLEDAVRGSAVSVLRVEGGWYAVLRLPRVMDEDAWVLRLLDAGVWVHPGHFFDIEDEPYVVVSLLTPPSGFEAGLERLLDTVEGVVSAV